MMNKKVIRSIAAGALMLSLAAVPVFANGRGNGNNRFCGNESERNCLPGTGRGIGMGNAQAMGTVSAVNTKDALITLKNADGKEVQIHVNPATYITLAGNLNKDMALADVKTGDWIAVNTFNTSTTILEAKRVLITRE
jgi:hypothetical protein